MGCCLEWSPLKRDEIDGIIAEKLLGIGNIRSYQTGAVFYWDGLNNNISMLLEGKVESAIESASGRKRTLYIHEGRSLLNDAMLIGPYYTVSFTCLSDAKVVFCEHEAVKSAGYQDPDILYFLARHNLIKMQALSFYLATQTFDDVETRIFFHLANLARTNGKKVDEDYYLIKEPLTHQLIADIVGSTRVRVTQIMKELTNQNVLKKTGKYYIINLGDNCRKTYFE